MIEQFNDVALVDLAKRHFLRQRDHEQDSTVGELLSKAKLTNSERNALIKFIYFSQGSPVLSMTVMKREIMAIIGFKASRNPYGNTVSRDELEAIYNFIKGLKK